MASEVIILGEDVNSNNALSVKGYQVDGYRELRGSGMRLTTLKSAEENVRGRVIGFRAWWSRNAA